MKQEPKCRTQRVDLFQTHLCHVLAYCWQLEQVVESAAVDTAAATTAAATTHMPLPPITIPTFLHCCRGCNCSLYLSPPPPCCMPMPLINILLLAAAPLLLPSAAAAAAAAAAVIAVKAASVGCVWRLPVRHSVLPPRPCGRFGALVAQMSALSQKILLADTHGIDARTYLDVHSPRAAVSSARSCGCASWGALSSSAG